MMRLEERTCVECREIKLCDSVLAVCDGCMRGERTMTDAERIEVLALAYALLAGSPWYRGEEAALRGTGPSYDAYCAVTAFSLAFHEKQGRWKYRAMDGDYHQLRRLLEAGVPGGAELPDYNDARGRRKRDVLRLYEKAAAKIGK